MKKRVARRRFLKVVPAALATGLAAPAIARQQGAEEPLRIPKETLDCAEKIFGVDFTDAEEEQAIRGVNRNLESFEQLRATQIPLDTEPAVTFRPYLPGRRPKPGATPGARIRVTLQAPAAAASSRPSRRPRSGPTPATTSPSCPSPPWRPSCAPGRCPRSN